MSIVLWALIGFLYGYIVYGLAIAAVLEALEPVPMRWQDFIRTALGWPKATETLARRAVQLQNVEKIVADRRQLHDKIQHRFCIATLRGLHMQDAFEQLYRRVLEREPDALTAYAKHLAAGYVINIGLEDPAPDLAKDLDEVRATADEIRTWLPGATD